MHKEILVIDDNPDIRKLVSNILEDQNFVVRSAANYDQAVLEINNRLPERGEIWYQWEIFFPEDYLSIFPAKNIHSQYKLISEKNKKKNSKKSR